MNLEEKLFIRFLKEKNIYEQLYRQNILNCLNTNSPDKYMLYLASSKIKNLLYWNSLIMDWLLIQSRFAYFLKEEVINE